MKRREFIKLLGGAERPGMGRRRIPALTNAIRSRVRITKAGRKSLNKANP
jgi:hypothetical protein